MQFERLSSGLVQPEVKEEYQFIEKNKQVEEDAINKEIREVISNIAGGTSSKKEKKLTKKELAKTIESIEQEMREAAKNLDFERAMELRDILFELKSQQ